MDGTVAEPIEFRLSPLRVLARYALPMVASMVLMQVYFMIDAVLIGRAIGAEALAAVNVAMPVLFVGSALGLLPAVGGAAIANAALGAGDIARARQAFSATFACTVVISALLSILGLALFDDLLAFLGAAGSLRDHAARYLRWVIPGAAVFLLGFVLDTFVRSEGKPNVALFWTAVASVLNIALDAVLLFVFRTGVGGAAAATVVSQAVAAVGLSSVFVRRDARLRFGRFRLDWHLLRKMVANGASEFLGAVSGGITLLIYNRTLVELAGSDGVAAFSIVGYLTSIVLIVVVAVAQGLQPVWGQHYGAGRHERLVRLRRTAAIAAIVTAVLAYGAMYATAGPMTVLMVGNRPELAALATAAARISGIGFVFAGVGLVASAYLTALGRAGASLALSAARSLVFVIAALAILPRLWGLTGVWLVSPVAEVLAVAVAVPLVVAAERGLHSPYDAHEAAKLPPGA